MKTNELHILGVVFIFLSSKLEDVKPIFMLDLLEDVTNMFTKYQILEAEMKVFNVLEFKMLSQTIYDYAFTGL